MDIISWNVLLRNHEEKYNPESSILKTWKNEENRCKNIIKILVDLILIKPHILICLQEVSDLLLKKIRTGFGISYMIFSQKLKTKIPEFLVTITPHHFINQNIKQNYDIAKALLLVKNPTTGMTVLNTHLTPQRFCKYNVMQYLGDTKNYTIIAGDFNEIYKNVNFNLGKKYGVQKFGNTYKKNQIDHIIILGKNTKVQNKNKINMNHISDHHLISLTLPPGNS